VVQLDADGLRSGLLEACGAAGELALRGAAARTLVRERFTWLQIATELVRRYETILAQSPRAALAYA
jgi:hypothetical protein